MLGSRKTQVFMKVFFRAGSRGSRIIDILNQALNEVFNDLPRTGRRINNSAYFYDLFSIEIEFATCWIFSPESLMVSLQDVQSSDNKAVLAGALAHGFFRKKRYDIASKFAHLSVFINFRDIFVTRNLTAINDIVAGGETTEDYLKRSWCNRPFTHLEVTDFGSSFVCCPHWLALPVGNMREASWQSIWKSDVAEIIRNSIHDGSFKYCNTMYCPSIAARSLPNREDTQNIKVALPAPSYVALSYDRSCNLSCPSCRNEIIVAGRAEQASFEPILANMAGMLPLSDQIQVTGSGDPFGSNHFRKLIAQYTSMSHDKKRLNLITNAQLCDERAWEELRLDRNVKQISVSVDAATSETYSIVRRPGNFTRLLNNLEFIARKRQQGEVEIFNLYFVIQSHNYREMPDFVELGIRLGADVVLFSRIRNWGTYSEDEFKRIDVFDSNHPRHQDFLEVMKSPILQSAPVTELPIL